MVLPTDYTLQKKRLVNFEHYTRDYAKWNTKKKKTLKL